MPRPLLLRPRVDVIFLHRPLIKFFILNHYNLSCVKLCINLNHYYLLRLKLSCVL